MILSGGKVGRDIHHEDQQKKQQPQMMHATRRDDHSFMTIVCV